MGSSPAKHHLSCSVTSNLPLALSFCYCQLVCGRGEFQPISGIKREVPDFYPLGASWDSDENGRSEIHQSQRIIDSRMDMSWLKPLQTTDKKIHVCILTSLEAHSYTQQDHSDPLSPSGYQQTRHLHVALFLNKAGPSPML